MKHHPYRYQHPNLLPCPSCRFRGGPEKKGEWLHTPLTGEWMLPAEMGWLHMDMSTEVAAEIRQDGGCDMIFQRHQLSSVQFSSVVPDSLEPYALQHARPPCPSPTPGAYSNSCLSSRWCHPAISSSVVPFSSCLQFPSVRVFSNKSALHIRWPKYSGLISFRMDWFNLLAVQGTLKSLLQHHSSKASILWCSAFFIVQLSHPYVTTGKASTTRQ